MAGTDGLGGRFPAHYTAVGLPSFTDFLGQAAPDLLPGRRPLPAGMTAAELSPQATTIIAATFAGGVLMAGDRRATMGNLISQRDIEKVYPADDHSLVGFAGVAGIGIELMRLFQVELEHYEKINEASLTLDGKANRLATLIRGNLPMAMQGLAALPLFAGFDLDATDPRTAGRIFSYDATGGGYEERYFHGVGSGSLFARGSLKKTWRPGLTRDDVVRVAVEALYDAADEDSATGGPDTVRRLYPIVLSVGADGVTRIEDDAIGTIVDAIISERTAHPGS